MIKYHVIKLYYEIKRTTITIVENPIFLSKQFMIMNSKKEKAYSFGFYL